MSKGRRARGVSAVYIIEAKSLGFVKIGRATDVPGRLSSLQVGCPVPLVLVGWSFCLSECDLHRELKRHRESGEWFRLKGKVASLVGSVKGGDAANWDILSPETEKISRKRKTFPLRRARAEYGASMRRYFEGPPT